MMNQSQNFIKQWRIEGILLTPLHVGSGQPLDLFNCVLENDVLHEYDLSLAISETDSDIRDRILDKLNAPINSVPQAEAVRMMLAEIPWRNHIVYSYELSAGAKERLIQNSDWGSYEITPFIHNPTNGIRYIPGSSLKGALRTGVVSERSLEIKNPPWEGKIQKDGRWSDLSRTGKPSWKSIDEWLERQTLGGNFYYDPFSEWFISDANFFYNRYFSRLCLVKNIHVNNERQRVSNLVEVIVNKSTENDPHFEFTITHRQNAGVGGVRKSVTIDELFNSATDHAALAFDDTFSAIPSLFRSEGEEYFVALDDAFNNLYDNECIIALGRYTGFLSKTVEKHRVLKEHKYHRNELQGDDANPITRNLADDGSPLGFIKLKFEEM